MKGHLRERSPGRWAIIIDTRDPQTGKRKRKWHSFKGTKRQAQDRCAELVAGRRDHIEPNKLTVAEFLETWLVRVEPKVSPRTFENYAEIARAPPHRTPARRAVSREATAIPDFRRVCGGTKKWTV